MTLSPPLLFLFLLFAVSSSSSSSSSDAAQSLRATTVARRQLESIARTPFAVELVVALYYVNESVEEQFIKAIRDSSLSRTTNSSAAITAAVQHFCKSVNEQATGSQVNMMAQAMSATVDTKISALMSKNDTECTIKQVQRILDDDAKAQALFGPGYSFILHVTVEQIVYMGATSQDDEHIMSQEAVSELIKSGFMRTTGGRTQFRTLLLQDPQFETISNVELLNGGPLPPWVAPIVSLSPSPSVLSPRTITPTRYPTRKPSTSPSLPVSTVESSSAPSRDDRMSTVVPFLIPPSSPSRVAMMPTFVPSSIPPTAPTLVAPMPTAVPSSFPSSPPSLIDMMSTIDLSFIPSSVPSLLDTLPTVEPSFIPSFVQFPTATDSPTSEMTDHIQSPENETKDKKDWIIGPVMGCFAFLVVAFFVFLYGCPFCVDRKDNGRRNNKEQPLPDQEQIVPSAAFEKGIITGSAKKLQIRIHETPTFTSTTRAAATKAPRSTKDATSPLHRSPLDINDKKNDDYEDKEEDIFPSLSDLYPAIVQKDTRRSSKSPERFPKFALALQRDCQTRHRASDLSGGKLPLATLNGPSDGPDRMIQGEPDDDDAEITFTPVGSSPLFHADGKDQVMPSFHLDVTPTVLSSANMNVIEEGVKLKRHWNDSVTSLDGSESVDIELLMMGEFSKSPESIRNNVKDNREPVESRKGNDEFVASIHAWTNGANETAHFSARQQNQSDYDDLLKSVLEKARQSYEAKQTFVPSVHSTSLLSEAPSNHRDLQSHFDGESSRADSPSAGSAPRSGRQKSVSIPAARNLLPLSQPGGSLGAKARKGWSTISEEKKAEETPESSHDISEINTNSTRLLEDIESKDSWIFEDDNHLNGWQSFETKSLEYVPKKASRLERFIGQESDMYHSKRRQNKIPKSRPQSRGEHGIVPRSLDDDLKRLDLQVSDVVLLHQMDAASSITSASTYSSR